MYDLEEIYNSFRYCITQLRCDNCQRASGCFGAKVINIPASLALDVANVLADAFPKVITLDQACGNLDAVYFESIYGPCTWVDGYIADDLVNAELRRFSSDPIIVPLESYGKTWRCWTSRPTDAQREAAAWQKPENN